MSAYCERLDENTLRFTRHLPGPIERVWAYLTEGEKRATWLAGGDWELRPGGRAELVFDNDGLSAPGDAPPERYADMRGEVRFDCKVLELDPPNRLVLYWPSKEGDGTEVTFELAEENEKVRLTLTHTGLTDPVDRAGAAAGWHTHLDIWIAKAESGEPASFWRTHTALEAEYETRLTG